MNSKLAAARITAGMLVGVMVLSFAACGKKAGAPIKVNSFVRFICGEGIEKRVDDFAGEIASMLNK